MTFEEKSRIKASPAYTGEGNSKEPQCASYWLQRSCGQGNIFTPVCHLFCSQGGSASVHAGIPPLEQTPPRADTHPWGQTPPEQTHTPWEQTPPLPGADPPGKQTPAYGLRAAGTHPTGMHSC